MSDLKQQIERLEQFPVVDPRGYTNARYRKQLNELLRGIVNRLEAPPCDVMRCTCGAAEKWEVSVGLRKEV